MKLNMAAANFRLVGPDETVSNRLDPVLEVTNRVTTETIYPYDDHESPDGRVMEVLTTEPGREPFWLLPGPFG